MVKVYTLFIIKENAITRIFTYCRLDKFQLLVSQKTEGNVIFTIFFTVCSTKASINVSKFKNTIKRSRCEPLSDINDTWRRNVFCV